MLPDNCSGEPVDLFNVIDTHTSKSHLPDYADPITDLHTADHIQAPAPIAPALNADPSESIKP